MRKSKPALSAEVWGAVRCSDGGEFVITSEIGCVPEQAKNRANAQDKLTPGYAEANPVCRIARFTLTEIK